MHGKLGIAILLILISLAAACTAAAPTAPSPPSPTLTTNIKATVVASIKATLEALQTATPVPTPTPDIKTRVEEAIRDAKAAAAPTHTPNISATVAASVKATLEALQTATRVTPKEVIKFHDGQWSTLWIHNAVDRYIIENGYGYPTEEVQGNTDTMKATLIEGDVHVNMEMWRMNIPNWYVEHTTSGVLVDLAGTTDPSERLPEGTKGQTISFGSQGFYVPTYLTEANPGLKSVSDLPDYWELFKDPNDPSKGVMHSCIIGWQCQKINRAKWYAYGLYDTYNVVEPGGADALKAGIVGPYEAGLPFLSYYWEPTDVVSLRDLTMLEEPTWDAKCQAALDVALAGTPYESTIGCGYPAGDTHTGVHRSLVERAPEVTEFLANLFIGVKPLAELEVWKAEKGREWREAAPKFLRENRDTWTTWITDEDRDGIIAKVDAALAQQP